MDNREEELEASFEYNLSLSDSEYVEELQIQEILEHDSEDFQIQEALEQDSEYAEDLQIQETLEYSSSNLPPPSSSTKICCKICFDDKENDEIFQIEGCTHSFCTDCISKLIESKLQEKIAFVSCPDENCPNIIEPNSLKSIIPEHIISRWDIEWIESDIPTSEKVYCPFNDCSELLVNDNVEGTVITRSECPTCRRLFCAQCKVAWHKELDCAGYRRSEEAKKDQEQFQSLANQNQWKECPSCKFVVERTEGCIHMTCRCKSEFCYVCGSEWDESHWTTCQSQTSQ